MTILVTGGTGFIGKRLVKALESRGEDIMILSRQSFNDDDNILNIDLTKESPSIEELQDISTIFHLAAYTHDLSNPKEMESLYKSLNIDATVRLANSAVMANVKRFIFVSSVKAGEPNINDHSKSIQDNHIPQGIYGETKREAEMQLLDITENTSMNLTIVRPSLVYGQGSKGNLSIMLEGIKKGWFPRFPKVHNRRSMIHVDDLVSAILFLEGNQESYGEIYIATDGEDYSINKIYTALCNLAGKSYSKWEIPLFLLKIIAKLNSNINYKVQKLIGDEFYSSKKLEELGFRPKLRLNDINKKIF